MTKERHFKISLLVPFVVLCIYIGLVCSQWPRGRRRRSAATYL